VIILTKTPVDIKEVLDMTSLYW